jgi:hypothetical protein
VAATYGVAFAAALWSAADGGVRWPPASGGQACGGEGGGGLLGSAGSLPAWRRWPVAGRRCWGPTFPGLSAGEGFDCLMLCPMQVGGGLWWLATSADLMLKYEPVS